MINSILPYEIFLIGKYFLRITDDYPEDGSHYLQIQDLRGRLRQFSHSAVDVSMIPMGSVFREFIILQAACPILEAEKEHSVKNGESFAPNLLFHVSFLHMGVTSHV